MAWRPLPVLLRILPSGGIRECGHGIGMLSHISIVVLVLEIMLSCCVRIRISHLVMDRVVRVKEDLDWIWRKTRKHRSAIVMFRRRTHIVVYFSVPYTVCTLCTSTTLGESTANKQRAKSDEGERQSYPQNQTEDSFSLLQTTTSITHIHLVVPDSL